MRVMLSRRSALLRPPHPGSTTYPPSSTTGYRQASPPSPCDKAETGSPHFPGQPADRCTPHAPDVIAPQQPGALRRYRRNAHAASRHADQLSSNTDEFLRGHLGLDDPSGCPTGSWCAQPNVYSADREPAAPRHAEPDRRSWFEAPSDPPAENDDLSRSLARGPLARLLRGVAGRSRIRLAHQLDVLGARFRS